MKAKFLLAAAALLIGAVAWSQLRITDFNSGGLLMWTNSAQAGVYRVEWANSPTGQWRVFDPQTNLNSVWVQTNRVTVQVPLSNTPTFYRVGWTLPDALGLWDYRCYDTNGTLIATGQLNFASRTIQATKPLVYRYTGTRDIRSVAQSAYRLPDLVGTGDLSGTLNVDRARLDVGWPYCADCGVADSGTIWPNTYTGAWYEVTIWGGYLGGTFRVEKH